MKKKPDLHEIVSPDTTLTIAGESITVRAFRFVEGLRATSIARVLIDDLRAILDQSKGGDIELDAILDLFGLHSAIWVQLMSMSIDKDIAWVEGLDDVEGMSLAMTFWSVNKDFFMTRLILGAAVREAVASSPSKLSANLSAQATAETPAISPSA